LVEGADGGASVSITFSSSFTSASALPVNSTTVVVVTTAGTFSGFNDDQHLEQQSPVALLPCVGCGDGNKQEEGKRVLVAVAIKNETKKVPLISITLPINPTNPCK
jgi:hypothetical protein